MNYVEMSDGEVNVAAAKAAYPQCEHFVSGVGDGIECIVSHSILDNRNFSHCNSWADAGPIIQESGMTLIKLRDGTFVCVSEFVDINSRRFSSRNLNPLRAAMIVFLMMQESKK